MLTGPRLIGYTGALDVFTDASRTLGILVTALSCVTQNGVPVPKTLTTPMEYLSRTPPGYDTEWKLSHDCQACRQDIEPRHTDAHEHRHTPPGRCSEKRSVLANGVDRSYAQYRWPVSTAPSCE